MDSTVPATSLGRVVRRTGRDLLQAVFPETCLLCAERIVDRDFFCAGCAPRQRLEAPKTETQDGFARQYTFLYEGALKTLFGAAKFSQRRRTRRFFQQAAAVDLAPLIQDGTVFIALPSRSSFLRKTLIAAIPKEKLILDAFKVNRAFFARDANKRLGEAMRYKRIRDSLVWNKPAITGQQRYILCDDVTTSGATLNHAAYLLQQNMGLKKEQIMIWALMFRPRLLSPTA